MSGLFDGNITMRTLQYMEKGLDAATLRREVIANNIANVDVPNFKRSEVTFEMELKRANDSMQREQAGVEKIRTNNPAHIDGRKPVDYHSIRPRVVTDTLSSMRTDGNNVDIEDEMSNLVRNQLQYSLITERLGGTLRQLNSFLRLV